MHGGLRVFVEDFGFPALDRGSGRLNWSSRGGRGGSESGLDLQRPLWPSVVLGSEIKKTECDRPLPSACWMDSFRGAVVRIPGVALCSHSVTPPWFVPMYLCVYYIFGLFVCLVCEWRFTPCLPTPLLGGREATVGEKSS